MRRPHGADVRVFSRLGRSIFETGVTDRAFRRLDAMSYTEADVARLGETLDTIDLDDGPRAALEALVTFAARKPSEVEALACQSSGRFKQALCEVLLEPVG